MKLKVVVKPIIVVSLLILFLINSFNVETVWYTEPWMITFAFLYILFLDWKIKILVKEIQTNVNQLDSHENTIKQLYTNQKHLIKAFKDIKSKLLLKSSKKNKQNKLVDFGDDF